MKRFIAALTVILTLSMLCSSFVAAQAVPEPDDSSGSSPLIVVILVAPDFEELTPGMYFPEYAAGCPQESKLPYTAPNFNGKKCFWVQQSNARAFFAETVMYTTGDFYSIVKNKWDGTMYDGFLLVNPDMKDGKVFFKKSAYNGKEVQRYFKVSSLTEDPRLTNYWMTHVADFASTLWEAVEYAAASKKQPRVTEAIVEHMIASDIVTEEELPWLTPDEITSCMLAYTDVALNHHLETVRSALANEHLTETGLKALQKNDTLSLYFDYSFGPVLHPVEKFVVIQCLDGVVTAGYPSSDAMFEFSWNDIVWLSDFIAVRSGKESY